MTAEREPGRRPEDFDADFADIVAGWGEAEPSTPPAPPPVSREYDPLAPTDPTYRPEPPPPLPRLSPVALVGTLLLGYAIVLCLLTVFGYRFPLAVGISGVVAFVVGLPLLLSRLPRRRDPLDGDGAQL